MNSTHPLGKYVCKDCSQHCHTLYNERCENCEMAEREAEELTKNFNSGGYYED